MLNYDNLTFIIKNKIKGFHMKEMIKIVIWIFIPMIFIGCAQKKVIDKSDRYYLQKHYRDDKAVKKDVSKMINMRN